MERPCGGVRVFWSLPDGQPPRIAVHMAVRAPWAGLFQVALTSAYGPAHALESLKKNQPTLGTARATGQSQARQ